MKRRVIVKAWLLGVFTTLLGKFRLTIADQITNIPDTTSSEFRSFIDTLLPEYLTPSGSQLGVHEKVLHIARLNPQSLELIRNGCDWLTAQAQGLGFESFKQAPEHAQIAIVSRAEKTPANEVARQFFQWTHYHAFRQHYSQERAWQYLKFDGPPQPRGFMDHSKSPKA